MCPRSVVRDAHERIVRCGLVIVPVSSETEDKFEDAMEVTASSPLYEIALVLMRLDHVADCVWFAIPQPTKWQRIGNQINAARRASSSGNKTMPS
jgi:hypothetical protein